MADVDFGVALAIGTQSDVNTINSTISGLTSGGGPYDETDGFILGDAESGDDGTGISLPDIEREFRALPDVAASLTPTRSVFERAVGSGLAVGFQAKGNGATSTPSSGEAQPDPGIHSTLLAAGLTGANGTAPQYNYTPTNAQTYCTLKLWMGGQSFVFKSCVVESLVIPLVGGQSSVATATWQLGSLSAQAVDAVPTIDYGNQSTLTPPRLEGAEFEYKASLDRGFSDMALEIQNAVERIPDSNVADFGERIAFGSGRRYAMNGTIWMDTTDTDFEYQALIDGVSSEGMTWHLGDAASIGETINSLYFVLSSMEVTSLSYSQAGAKTHASIQSHATNTSPNAEFVLTYQ